MFQVRIHGRGGQGVVTAAEMLSIAAFEEGRHAQAFPSFGSERTGAPQVLFGRIRRTKAEACRDLDARRRRAGCARTLDDEIEDLALAWGEFVVVHGCMFIQY